MKHYLLLCLLPCLPALAGAQHHAALLLKFRPTALLDLETPVVHLGVEFRTPWPVSGEIGYGIQTRHSRAEHNYQKYRAELRYRLPDQGINLPISLAFETFFLRRHDERSKGFYVNHQGKQIYYTNARINYKINVPSMKVIFDLPVSPRWSVEIFSGLGVRFRTVYYSNVEQNQPISYFLTNCILSEYREGRRRFPHFTFGAQVAFSITGPVNPARPKEYRSHE